MSDCYLCSNLLRKILFREHFIELTCGLNCLNTFFEEDTTLMLFVESNPKSLGLNAYVTANTKNLCLHKTDLW